jgi:Arc/MetJ-type ribon-helix-helix transcriptional regulator
MDIALTPEQQDIIGHAVATGRVAAPEDAVREALELWVVRERRRSEILAVVDEAEAALVQGKGIPIAADGISGLIADVQQRGRERLGSG